MASKALKLRIKAEISEAKENKNGSPAAVPMLDLENDTTNAGRNNNLLEVPSSKAVLATFPPGCPVLYTDTTCSVVPNLVYGGVVENVFVDLSPRVACDYVYEVRLQNHQDLVLARETELQWAPKCSVWMKPLWKQDTQGLEWKEALILGSYLADGGGDKSPLLYSVQQVETGNGTFHGLTKDYIRYRSEQVLSDTTLTCSNNGQQVPALSKKIHSTKSDEAVAPTPVSQPLPFASLDRPPITSSIPTLVSMKPPRVTMSPRKRPFSDTSEPLETLFPDTSATVDEDPAMGRFTAEFRMPYWIKGACLNDDFIDQVVLGCNQCTGCNVVVLETSSPIANKRKSSPSKAPRIGESIFIYGNSMQNVEHACILVSHLLQEYVKKKQKKKLATELEKGWKKTTHDHAVNLSRASTRLSGTLGRTSSAYKKNVSPNKKAKIDRSPSSEEDGEIVESTAKMLLQAKSTIVSSSLPAVKAKGGERRDKKPGEPSSTTLLEESKPISQDSVNNDTLLPAKPSVAHSIPVQDDGEEMKRVEFTLTTLLQKWNTASQDAVDHNRLSTAKPATVPSVPSATKSAGIAPETLLSEHHTISGRTADQNSLLQEHSDQSSVMQAKTAVASSQPPVMDDSETETKPVGSSPASLLRTGRTISDDTISEASVTTDETESDQAIAMSPPAILRKSSTNEEYSTGEYVARPFEQGPMTRILRVPQFTNQHFLEDALVGENEKNRKCMLDETGCDVRLKYPTKPLNPIKIAISGAYQQGDMDFAQRWVENRIVSTVPDDQKGRMLYYLAKDNNYGASEGEARYQRSPFDLQSWSWMCVVELPHGFDRLLGLFLDKGGKAIKAIVRQSGCRHVMVSETLPKHVFLCSPNLEMVEAATKAVNARVAWSLREANSRKRRW